MDAGIDTIKRIVAEAYHVPVAGLSARGRTEPLATARQIAMFLGYKLYGASCKRVGEEFSRDYATVVYSSQSITDRASVSPIFRRILARLTFDCACALGLPAESATPAPVYASELDPFIP